MAVAHLRIGAAHRPRMPTSTQTLAPSPHAQPAASHRHGVCLLYVQYLHWLLSAQPDSVPNLPQAAGPREEAVPNPAAHVGLPEEVPSAARLSTARARAA